MTDRRDNFPPPADWVTPVGRHCGEMCFERECPFCGVTLPQLPANVILGGWGE